MCPTKDETWDTYLGMAKTCLTMECHVHVRHIYVGLVDMSVLLIFRLFDSPNSATRNFVEVQT